MMAMSHTAINHTLKSMLDLYVNIIAMSHTVINHTLKSMLDLMETS